MIKKISFIFLLIVSSGLIYYGYQHKFINIGSVTKGIASPLPNLLTSSLPKVLASSDEYFKPNIDTVAPSQAKKPEINAVSALSYDLTTNTLLFSKNIKMRLPIASLTKIMTATVALENSDLDHNFKVSKKAATIGEDSMGLSEGEELPLSELLYGLVLNSGNDAAEVIAEGSPFGRDNFVYLMNKKAESLGLSDTHFTNPTGLEGDGNQYSTAVDILVMTRYALAKNQFADVAATYEHDIPANNEHKEYHLYNETNLLTTYPGVKGVKTGYTYEAGLCLVTYLDHEGHKIIAVVLNAQNRRQEMKDLLDYSLKTLGVKPPLHD